MAQLLELGAPKLPEGLFYRISNDGYGGFLVAIREDRKRFGSKQLVYNYISLSADPSITVEMLIEKSCKQLHATLMKEHALMIEHRRMRKYEGDHR